MSTRKIGPKLESILDEIIAYSTSPPLAEGEFIVLDYISRLKETKGIAIDESTARKHLNVQVRAGRLTRRQKAIDGVRRNIYRPVSQDEVDITTPS